MRSCSSSRVRTHVGAQIGADMTWNAALCLCSHSDCRTDLSRCTIAALEAVMVDKGLLQRMQAIRGRKSFHRRDRASVILDGQRQAGQNPFPLNQHRTGPACALVTTLFGAGEVQFLTQKIQKRYAVHRAVVR